MITYECEDMQINSFDLHKMSDENTWCLYLKTFGPWSKMAPRPISETSPLKSASIANKNPSLSILFIICLYAPVTHQNP